MFHLRDIAERKTGYPRKRARSGIDEPCDGKGRGGRKRADNRCLQRASDWCDTGHLAFDPPKIKRAAKVNAIEIGSACETVGRKK